MSHDDHALPLKGSTYGPQYAGWTPTAFAMQGLGNRALLDQFVDVGDGVGLHADVYLPKVEGRYPAVVCFAGYSTEGHTAGLPSGTNEIGSPPVFTDRGYCPVVVERRGMGRSTGEQVVFFDPQDVDDHEKVIAWAAEQPWCNGDVVLFGTSYYGMVQPLVAARRPQALRAFFAHELCTDFYRHLVAFGGVPGLIFLNLWMGANFTQEKYDERMSEGRRALISHVTNGMLHPLLEKIVHKNVGRLFASFMSAMPVEAVRRMYVNWVFDGKTRETSTIPEGSTGMLGQIDVPFVAVQNLGHFNVHQFGTYDLFENTGTPDDQKWMIVGPAQYDLPVYEWQGEALAFFDYVLRGTENGYEGQPHVRYWVDGAGEFGTGSAFPPLDGTPTRLYLASTGEDEDLHRLALEPATESANTWVAVPLGLPVIGGLDDVAVQSLGFEISFDRDVRLAGAVTANLRFSCNEIDSFVMARLSRIDAEGDRHHLSMGAIRPAAPTEDAPRSTRNEIAIDSGRRVPLVPGEPVTLRFSLTPGPTHVKPGEKLRLDIASRSDLLRLDPSQGYGHYDLPVPPYLCRNTVHMGNCSWIEVTEIPLSAPPV
ncbi:CocE/NonD family hydrolase [Microbacterium sp. NPDC064584]|uniref:CocE/NonD family hydrolase n=1 Tax=Microbacterium sp. NPDC064584 TaxID=3155817 RepID=UPI00341AF4FE